MFFLFVSLHDLLVISLSLFLSYLYSNHNCCLESINRVSRPHSSLQRHRLHPLKTKASKWEKTAPPNSALFSSFSAGYSSDIPSSASRIKKKKKKRKLWDCHAAFEACVPLLGALRVLISPHRSSFAEQLLGPRCAAVMNSAQNFPQGAAQHGQPDSQFHNSTPQPQH